MSTSVLKALPDKLDIGRHSPSILYDHSQDHLTHYPENYEDILGYISKSGYIENTR